MNVSNPAVAVLTNANRCTKCGGVLLTREMPYLVAPSGTQPKPDGTIECTDTGMHVTVLFCAVCENTQLPVGSRPHFLH